MAKAASVMLIGAIAARSRLQTLFLLGNAAMIIQFIVVLYVGIPAWRRTRQKGFLFWNTAAVIGLCNTVMLNGVVYSGSFPPEYVDFARQTYYVVLLVNI